MNNKSKPKSIILFSADFQPDKLTMKQIRKTAI